MKKLPVDELTRLAFIYAEQDRRAMVSALISCTAPDDVASREMEVDLVRQLREYRLKRWGKTNGDLLDEQMHGSNMVNVGDLVGKRSTSK